MCFKWSWRTSRNGYALMKYLIVLVALPMALIGCSGGGGGGGSAPPANSAPVITAGCDTTFQSGDFIGGMYTGNKMGNLQAMDPDGDPISFSLDLNNPMMAGPIPTANGGSVMLTDTTTGAFTYTPPTQTQGPRGADTFMFRVDDPSSFSTATETIIVNPKVMPLGDSITEGNTGGLASADRVSYRLELLNDLAAADLDIEFVGELIEGGNFLPANQTGHAGYSGAQDQHIANGMFALIPSLTGIFDELEQNPADIVLLHIGTNDVNNVDPDPSDLEAILNEIGRWEDSVNGNPVSVFVMQIINQCINQATGCLMGGGAQEANIMAYNANVIDRIMNPVSGLALPDQVVFGAELDMFTAFGGTSPVPMLFADDFHPSPAGYTVMEDVILASLTGPNQPTILQACP